MTLRRLLLLATFPVLLLSSGTRAQMAEEALPESATEEPDPLGENLPLIPEALPPAAPPDYTPDLPVSSEVQQSIGPAKASETRLAIEEREQQLKMRRARMKAERDAGAQALFSQADSAETDAEKRYAMHLYYDRLYTLMLKIDPTLKQETLKERRDEAVSPMSQDRLRPSVWAGAPDVAR